MAEQRRYTLDEIDAMRNACHTLYANGCGGNQYTHVIEERSEDMLRTYMLNGTDPAELVAKAQASQEDETKRWAEYHAEQEAKRLARGEPN